ncbi:sulfurtransferase complex subunit TusD [Litoribacillus peritrichatus]|uniref:Sulfurtransferase complex subunit TusD n=1 Tax=Litoribacillus peritrichatus TaxID=718191 RepID=A0ABP7N200_9GAMM
MNQQKTFSLFISPSAWSSQAHSSALNFAQSALKANHSIYRVFFYSDATLCANNSTVAPQDELNIPLEWVRLAKEHKIDLVTCISAAIKRGILDETEQNRYAAETHNLSEEFSLSGLGQLVDAIIHSDRVISF